MISFNINSCLILTFLLTACCYADNSVTVHGTEIQRYGYGQVKGNIIEGTCIPESISENVIYPVASHNNSYVDELKDVTFSFNLNGCSSFVKQQLKVSIGVKGKERKFLLSENEKGNYKKEKAKFYFIDKNGGQLPVNTLYPYHYFIGNCTDCLVFKAREIVSKDVGFINNVKYEARAESWLTLVYL